MARKRTGTRRKNYKIQKYSSETITGVLELDGTATKAGTLIQALDAQGMRKAKNFTLNVMTEINSPVYFALVYVPEGTKPSAITLPTTEGPKSMYEPNQNVILQGIINPATGAITKRTRLARNLNGGDKIDFIAASLTAPDPPQRNAVLVSLNYAITY